MEFTAIIIFAIMVSVSKALVYDPFGNGNTQEDYYDGVNSYSGDGDFYHRNELNKVEKEKLLAIASALLQQGNNPYNPFTDLFTFKGHKGKNRVNWRKWLNYYNQNAPSGTSSG